MSTQHDPHAQTHTRIRPLTRPSVRCLRHRVWMAACDDCRDVHRDPATEAPRQVGPAA